MIRQPVRSSDLKSVGYDEEKSILEIEFHSGGIYLYSNVPEAINSGLMNASSLGKFFHQYIKDKFPTRRIA